CGRLGDGRVRHGRGLDLGGTDPLPGDLERVVRAALDVPVARVVDACPVAMDPDVREPRPIRLQVAALFARARIAPEAARHARPGLADDQLAHRAAHGPPLFV